MRAALVVCIAIATTRVAAADWTAMHDIDCRCELALPGKPVASTRPSPWPNLAWHRSEVRISPTEWYAVSYVVFDKAPPVKAFETALAALHGTVLSRAQQDARVKLGDGSVIAVRFATQDRRAYLVEAGDVAKGTTPDKLFAGFHAWTDKDAPPEGTVASVTGDSFGGGDSFGTIGHAPPPEPAKVEVSIGHIAVDGKLAVDTVHRYLHRNRSRVAACYGTQKRAKPKLGYGTINLAFTVEPGGNVALASATGFDAEVSACIVDFVNGIELPKPGEGAPAKVKAELLLRAPS